MSKIKEPKDLGLKIGTKAESFWTKVKNDTKIQLENIKNQLIFTEAVLKLAEDKIKLEALDKKG